MLRTCIHLWYQLWVNCPKICKLILLYIYRYIITFILMFKLVEDLMETDRITAHFWKTMKNFIEKNTVKTFKRLLCCCMSLITGSKVGFTQIDISLYGKNFSQFNNNFALIRNGVVYCSQNKMSHAQKSLRTYADGKAPIQPALSRNLSRSYPVCHKVTQGIVVLLADSMTHQSLQMHRHFWSYTARICPETDFHTMRHICYNCMTFSCLQVHCNFYWSYAKSTVHLDLKCSFSDQMLDI